MPLQTPIKVEQPTGEGYEPVPDGLYQVVIKDVKLHKSKKYESDEEEEQLLFSTTILNKQIGKGIGIFARISWFNGVTKRGASVSASKLYSLVKAIYGFYHDKVDVDTLHADDVNMDFINDLLGKQVVLSVKLVNGKNKITDFAVIEKELEVPAEDSAQEEGTAGNENVDPSDIPF
jgi:hypothetical protein